DSSGNIYLAGETTNFEGPDSSMVLVKYGVVNKPILTSYDLLLFIIIIGVITAITAISLNKKYSKKFLP
ncbi:MAG: hypothetical protein ACFFFT_15175, partial [Candidatus Thorarchaeota archaeon]